MWHKIVLIALAGAAGTLARFGLASLVQRLCGDGFPWGTLAVNSLGCLLFGATWQLAEQRLAFSSEARLIVLTGFMGAFTTFSTFAFETSRLLHAAQWPLAAVNIVGQNLLGIACIFAGFALSRHLGW